MSVKKIEQITREKKYRGIHHDTAPVNFEAEYKQQKNKKLSPKTIEMIKAARKKLQEDKNENQNH